MDYVTQLNSDKELGKQSLFEKLNSLAMDALSSMKNEGTEQVDEAKFINVATSQKEIDTAKKALADSPDMFHGAKAGFKRVITQHQKFIEDQKTVKEDTEQVDESVTVHVKAYGSKPDKKDTDHVKSGVELYNGAYDGHSDKGSYFKFKTEDAAKKFKSHVDKSPNKTTYADVLDESAQADEARKIDQFENGIHKATVHKDSDTGEYQVKFHTNGKHLKDADYFTDEKDDAIGTAKHQISKMKPDSGFANKVD